MISPIEKRGHDGRSKTIAAVNGLSVDLIKR